MCKYCDSLKEYKTITIPIRTSMADNNICEFARPDLVVIDEITEETANMGCNCKGCLGCAEENNYFSVDFWNDDMCINYYHKIDEVIIAPVSARFSINYCPMCGKKINDGELIEELKFW